MKTPCRLTAVTLILLTSIMVLSYSGKETMAAPDVDPDSVLNVIPQDTVGVIYIPTLLGLNDEINALLAQLIPENPPQELPAQILAETFGAGFETLEELEELGLDLRRNFAVFFSGVNPLMYAAAVHVKDAESVKQLIEMEAEGSSAITHNGMTYHTTGGEGAFVLMGDVMVYSDSAAVCEKVIDTHQKAMPSIAANADFQALKLDTTSGMNDLIAYFAMDVIVEANLPALTEMAEETKAEMQASAEADPQLTVGLGYTESLIDGAISLLDQSKTLSLTVQLNGSDLQISPFLKFKQDSEIQAHIHQMPRELEHLKHLPQNAFLNGEIQFQKAKFIDITQIMMESLTPTAPNADTEDIEKADEARTEVSTDFYAALGNEVAFSVNFSQSIMPDVLYIYDVKDEKQVKTYMEKDFINIYKNVSAGPPEIYKGVEIKHYIQPNIDALFTELPSGMGGIAPEQWNIYYAISDGKILHAMAANAQPIKDTIDRMAGMGAGFDQGAGYAKLTDALTLKNNMFFALSPITAVKSLVQILAQADPNIGMVQMFLVNIPETYSIGIASQNRDNGVAGELFISIGDFKEIILMLIGLQQMGGIQ